MIPRRVVSVSDGRLRIADGDREREVVAGPDVAGIAAGEYVLVYANAAIEKVSEEEAQEQLAFLRSLGELSLDGGPTA